MEKHIAHLEKMIAWQEHVRGQSKDPKQQARCYAAIEKLMAQAMDLRRTLAEKELTQGVQENSAWYSKSAELI